MDKSPIQMILSILIPTTRRRQKMLNELLNELRKQIGGIIVQTDKAKITTYTSWQSSIEIITDGAEHDRIGTKRNRLLYNATGKYVCFIDDDDMVSPDYIQVLRDGIKTDPDCISLRGIMTTNGQNPEVFEHSIKYQAYKTTDNEIKYERYPNHISCIRSSIAKQFKFPETNWGEDTDWATKIFKSGLIRNEYYHEKVLYYYCYISNK